MHDAIAPASFLAMLEARALGLATLSLLVGALHLTGCGSAEDDTSPPALEGDDPAPGDEPGDGTDKTPPSLACPAGKVSVDASSLTLDGVDDHVSMGLAASLGLEHFTVEAWVKRDGAGVPFSTGVGGLSLVPIAGRGRGESDGTNVDCNYTMGFAGDVLGADFEDLATGDNHPVLGKTAIRLGEWHHVAASYDGVTWRLFVDGKLDGESAAQATPRSDSIQHFAVGSALNSKGVPAGFLRGSVDEVRVWDRARAEAEIAGAMYKRVPTEANLVGRWAFDAADNAAPDSAGKNPGKIIGGATFATTGAILDVGLPPAISAPMPSATDVTGASTKLSVALADADSKELTATFHVRQIVKKDDFTIVVMPDTQYYVRDGDNPLYFEDQTKWIMANRAAYNIVGVIHNGDIVDKGSNTTQWVRADKAMKKLEVTSKELPEGMPYGTCAGNHDQEPNGDIGETALYNQYFGTTRFNKRSYFGGTFAANKVDENWVTFSTGGLDIVVVNLQFGKAAREAPVLDWTRSIMKQHPDALGIVNSHYILTGAGNFSAAGKSIYEAVKDIDNVQLLTCGHVGAEQVRTDTYKGNAVHSMLADYQFRANGGAGYMRIWEFSPANDELTVRSYSPTEKKFETDKDSEFTLKVDLAKVGGAFKPVATVDPAPASTITADLPGLAPGQTYEWYVTVTDCAHTVSSPTYRFKTK